MIDMDIVVTDEIRNRFAEHGLFKGAESTDTIRLNSDGHDWNTFYIPDKWGNKTNSVSEIKTIYNRR